MIWEVSDGSLGIANFEEHACQRDASAPVPAGYTIGRQVLSIT